MPGSLLALPFSEGSPLILRAMKNVQDVGAAARLAIIDEVLPRVDSWSGCAVGSGNRRAVSLDPRLLDSQSCYADRVTAQDISVVLNLVVAQVVAEASPKHVLAVCLQAVTLEGERVDPSAEGFVASASGCFRALKGVEFGGHDLLDDGLVGLLELPSRQGFTPLDLVALTFVPAA